MPFTFAHPAAVLPLSRKLIFSALVVGAMAPDFAYFLHPSSPIYTSHTVVGIFRFCLPVGFLVLWLFHRLLKRPAIALFPELHQQRLLSVAGPFEFWSVHRFFLILLSLFVGILTHVAWDSVSNPAGLAVKHVAWLRHIVFHGSRIAVYDVIWYASTFVGMAILVIAYRQWYAVAPVQPAEEEFKIGADAKRFSVACMLLIPVALALLYTYSGTHFSRHDYPLEYILFRLVASCIAMMFGMLWLFSIAWYCLRAPIARYDPHNA